jgi:hypothetical protein
MLGAAEAEDPADIAGTMRRRPLPAPVFQGGGINGARRPPAGGAKLLGEAIPLKGVEAAEEPFEGLARDYPFQTFKKRRSKKKEAVSIEFEAVALEAKLLLQGGAAVSIRAEFMQSEDNFSLLRNRPPEAGMKAAPVKSGSAGPRLSASWRASRINRSLERFSAPRWTALRLRACHG